MSQSVNQIISQLPLFIRYIILTYVSACVDDFHFDDYRPNCSVHNYGSQYQIAFDKHGARIEKTQLENSHWSPIYLLSRLPKKNNKYRYYITLEKYTQQCGCCGSYECHSLFCRGGFTYEYEYSSKYVGKNLELALIEFNTIS
jgi:hypothetical protein